MGALETKLDRLLWLVRERAGGGQRELARMAGLAEGHVGVLVTRLRRNPDADLEGDTLAKIAAACRVNPAWIVTGALPRDVEDPIVERTPRYESLEDVISHPENRGRWSPGAIAEVRSSALTADADPGEAHWTERLDRAEQALKLVRMPFPKLPDRGVDPLAGLDDPAPSRPRRR